MTIAEVPPIISYQKPVLQLESKAPLNGIQADSLMPVLILDVTTRGTLFEMTQSDIPAALADSVKFRYRPVMMQETDGAEQVVRLFFDLPKDVAISEFASWLYDRLQQRQDASAKISGIPVRNKETIEEFLAGLL